VPSSAEIPVEFAAIEAWLRTSPPIDEADLPPSGPPVSFVELWQRVAVGAMGELASSLPHEAAAHYRTRYEGWAEYGDVHADLTDDLVTRLSAVGEAAIWEEFNSRRTPGDIVMAHLRTDGNGSGPPRAIYCRLLEEMRSEGLGSLTAQYPVLRRHLSTTVQHWLGSSREILTRARSDRDHLAEAFDLPPDARLAGIRQGLGDPHRGGRTVAILSFACGAASDDRRTLVYKPKDLGLDRAFQQFLAEVPSPSPADGLLRDVGVVARDGYGYMEWMPHVLCDGDGELRRFYRNAGRLTAVLYLLGCNDCHHENFIASGDQLLLVDGETLFQGTPYERNTDRRQSSVRSRLYDRMGNSVVRLGLLPQWHFVGDKRTPHDVSALGIRPPRQRRRDEPGWIGLNTDGMVSGRVGRLAEVPTSSPVGIGSNNRLSDFEDDFCHGFGSQLVAIAAERRRWLAADGHLARFRRYRSRFVRRPTRVYVWVLGQLSEPASLSSEAAQRAVRESLAVQQAPFKARPSDPRLLAAEDAQIDHLDVPFFEQPVDGVDLLAPDGSTLAGYFEVSGYENARQKLERLDGAEIDLELALIRAVIAAKGMHAHRAASFGRAGGGRRLDEPSVEERSREATAVGDLVVRTAISDGTGAVEWLAIDTAQDIERSSYGPLGLGLYGGRSGIALFLAALAGNGAADSDGYRRTAIGACSDVERLRGDRSTADDLRAWWRGQPLGLAGAGGVLLALRHLGDLVPDLAPELDDVTSVLVDAVDVDVLRADEQLDVIFGSAGLIGALLKIGTPKALSLARAAGDTLVGRQDASGGWVTPSSGPAPLTGFSHGASGMAAALATLHAGSPRDAYLDAAAKALRYERQLFDPAERNWPDLRATGQSGTPSFMLSWCHGAPGIALARLCLAQSPLWDADVERDLHHALESTTDRTLPEDSLCCGRFGRAAVLRVAAAHEGGGRWLEAAVQLEAQGLAQKLSRGTYSFNDVPGLFQGAAGVGLALLEGVPHETASILPSVLSAGLYTAASPG
jgi:type 2 lantibiotic biosynthesis protein LanM